MKFLSIFLITFYQVFCSPLLHHLTGTRHACRFSPSCSEFTKQMIAQYGFLKGGRLGLKQLLACHPYHRYATV